MPKDASARRCRITERNWIPVCAPTWEKPMLYYAIVFLIIALVAGFFGFFGIAGLAASIAKILFVVFIILFIVSLIFGRRRPL